MTILWWSIAALAFANVALALTIVGLRTRSDRRARHRAAVDERWRPRLYALVAGDISPQDLAEQVTDRDVDRILDLCAQFAQRLTGHDLELIEEFAGGFAGRFAQRLTASDVDARAHAVMLLSAVGGRRHERALAKALGDPDPLVAMVAAQAIARHGLVDHVPQLIDRVSAHGVWSPAFVAGVLAEMGLEAGDVLRRVLVSPSNLPAERATAALALAAVRDPRAAGDAAAVLIETGAPRDLTAACLRVLEAVGRPVHLAPIRSLLEEGDAVVRARAAAALGQLGTAADAAVLERLVADPSRWVALSAAAGLRRLHREDLLEQLAAGGDGAALVAAEALESEVVL